MTLDDVASNIALLRFEQKRYNGRLWEKFWCIVTYRNAMVLLIALGLGPFCIKQLE